ncbi:MAG: Holliday junction branch migration protein RuvA [Actinobacteria bacterium]|jgi:Holliday junction DNA helicase RuvA|nr:Holliday junction branch migration protein RuvA [Actinomycetota bacterium]
MIGSLRGTLLETQQNGEVLIEVGGIGYRVLVNPAVINVLPQIDETVFMYVHHHIREGAQQLYGFTSIDERQCFELLLDAHGVGPSLGMAILAVLPPKELRRAVAADDIDALCMVAGVGKKTAQRLLLEMKSRLEEPHESNVSSGDSETGNDPGALADVRAALSGMGFVSDEIRVALKDLDESDSSALLRKALQRLAAR